ncbi:MAG: HAD family hydrolase [Pyrinomonadaceae bacterium]
MRDSQIIIDSTIRVSPAELRILLWDVDGTLLQSTRPGRFRDYFSVALEKVYGTKGKIAEAKASGATDTHIVFQSLKDDGWTIEQISARMNEFIKVLCAEMEKYTESRENIYEILPGVLGILRATDANPRFINALLTGNIGCGAEIKCRQIGVWQYFENSLNTFGDISHDRRQLAVKAGEIFNRHYKAALKPAQFIVIGDTPHDIAMAKNFGAKILSVETGRGISRAILESEKPDFLIKDLSDTRRILQILETL